MGVTQKQIAERLNLSQSLVARALKGYTQVSDETRGLIEKTALEMGYGLGDNREARALIAKRYGTRVKTGVIAVATSPGPGVSIRGMPYAIPAIEGIETEAATHNIDVCLCITRKDEIPRLVRDRSIDGLITFGYHARYFEAIRSFGLPLVTFHNFNENAHSVVADDRGGAAQLTRHLLALGHRRIGFLGVFHESGQPCAFRLQGYREAMAEQGIAVPDEWIIADHQMPFANCSNCGVCAACLGWNGLLSQNPGAGRKKALPFTALICYNDTIAMRTIANIQADGFTVPRDISIAGFDDLSPHTGFQPAITSIGFSLGDMGRSAMQLLHEVIEAPNPPAHYIHRIFPVEIAIHDSTAPPRE